jgi:hypothetical protein
MMPFWLQYVCHHLSVVVEWSTDVCIAAPNHNLRLRYIKNLVSSLPKQNIELLKYLFALLRKVNEHSKGNTRMNGNNTSNCDFSEQDGYT